MKKSYWFAALSAVCQRSGRMRDCSRHDPQIPDQFQHATRRKHLGRLLINSMNSSQTRVDRNAAVRFRTVEMAFGARAGLRGNANER